MQCSILIIKRLNANMNVKRKIPNNGDAKTMNDIANDKTLTPNRNILDHFEILLAVMPSMFHTIPINKDQKLPNQPVFLLQIMETLYYNS